MSSVALLRAVVAKLPGAISYLSADKLEGSLKALRIDGKDHASPDYPLKVLP